MTHTSILHVRVDEKFKAEMAERLAEKARPSRIPCASCLPVSPWMEA